MATLEAKTIIGVSALTSISRGVDISHNHSLIILNTKHLDFLSLDIAEKIHPTIN